MTKRLGAGGDAKESLFSEMPRVLNPHTCRMDPAFFADRDPKFLNALAKHLEKEVFEKGDLIIKEGTKGHSMYFIYSGSVSVCVGPALLQVATLKRGSYFGEMALFGITKRSANISALEHTECLVVKRRIFSTVLASFPEEKKFFSNMATSRIDALRAKRQESIAAANAAPVQQEGAPKEYESDVSDDAEGPETFPVYDGPTKLGSASRGAASQKSRPASLQADSRTPTSSSIVSPRRPVAAWAESNNDPRHVSSRGDYLPMPLHAAPRQAPPSREATQRCGNSLGTRLVVPVESHVQSKLPAILTERPPSSLKSQTAQLPERTCSETAQSLAARLADFTNDSVATSSTAWRRKSTP
eukprot:TRINITY_DN26383_c0_g1_i1.p1 TRINITY_DN26383_c0_g1~~TRINITY_DN26383_c0_g1_i1.p1  ORF type:complete len:357 (+),score=56.57 TRINITY_DN26383_c0_g1_i1:122-1192(+)